MQGWRTWNECFGRDVADEVASIIDMALWSAFQAGYEAGQAAEKAEQQEARRYAAENDILHDI
jgi:hypothetical protein